jgi:Na+/proline symporter
VIAAVVVFAYLALVLYVGIFAFRRKKAVGGVGGEGKEEFFVANRGLGTFVFLLSLFGSNMTSFAILGSSGLAFRQGIGVYGLMASISGIVIPMSIFLIGTRLWSIGKRFGHITQVQILRDRFEMGHIGTVVWALQAVMLVPYIIIGVMGGGETLEGVSGGAVPYWLGGLIVALVVMSYVFFGGMRGTALVNTVQTLMFLTFGTIAFIVIARGMGGLGETVKSMAATLEPPATPPVAGSPPVSGGPPPVGQLLTRDRIGFWYYASYMFIPLSSIMFPHIAIFCLTAKKLASFRKTVIFYPLCIMAIWMPAVFLGAISGGRGEVVAALAAGHPDTATWLESNGETVPPSLKLPGILAGMDDERAKAIVADVQAGVFGEAASAADRDATLGRRLAELRHGPLTGELRRLASGNADGVMLSLLGLFTPAILAGLLGAAIMACVMASDSQILAMSTMFSEDVFAFYGGRRKFGERAEVWSARIFVVFMTIVAYWIALAVHQYANIFEIAIQYAFSGYASLAPIMLACLFWKRATKWGVLASTLWVAAWLIGSAWLQWATAGIAPTVPGAAAPIEWLSIGDTVLFYREAVRISFTSERFLLVMPMFIGAAALLVLVSLITRRPSAAAIERYFPSTSTMPGATRA